MTGNKRLRDAPRQYTALAIDLIRWSLSEKNLIKHQAMKRLYADLEGTPCASCSQSVYSEMYDADKDATRMRLHCKHGTSGVVCPDEQAAMRDASAERLREATINAIWFDESGAMLPNIKPIIHEVERFREPLPLIIPKPKDEPTTIGEDAW